MVKKGLISYYPVEKEVDISQRTRAHPAIKGMPKAVLRAIDAYADEYIEFLNKIQITPDAVNEAVSMFEKNRKSDKDFYMTDEEGTAFSAVRFGKRPTSEGVRMFFTHCDSPCLELKVNPLLFEWDTDLRDLHLGVELDTIGYGGINPHQWTGRRLLVKGWAYINNQRREISFPVYSAEVAVHTDTRLEQDTSFREAHTLDSLDLIPGDRSRKEFIKRLEFFSEMDFARARLYAVPIATAERLHDYYITGHGQDDRIGIFASLKALLSSRPKYTTIVFGFDKEEVGSGGLSGANGKFLEQTIDEILFREEGKAPENITESLLRHLYGRSIGINADVDVGSTDKEEDVVDKRNVGKLGYGMFISGYDGMYEADQISPKLVDTIMSAIDSNPESKKNNRKIVVQTIGSVVSPDNGQVASMNEYFVKRGIPTINCCVALGSLHSPEEISHVGDLYHTIKAYKAIIESS